jgi:hypothetical protein
MMTETLEYLEKGLIKPIAIAKNFDASSVAEAFKHLLQVPTLAVLVSASAMSRASQP